MRKVLMMKVLMRKALLLGERIGPKLRAMLSMLYACCGLSGLFKVQFFMFRTFLVVPYKPCVMF